MTLKKLLSSRCLIKIVDKIDEKTLVEILDKSPWVKKDLLLVLHSGGGDADIASSVVRFVKSFELDTLGLGRVESAAFNIFLAGKNRYIVPETIFMFHHASSSSFIGNNFPNRKMEIITNRMRNQYKSFNLKLGPRLPFFKDKLNYITSEKALSIGIATEILT